MVIFSHAPHSKAPCSTCHGDVNLHLTRTMKACVDCHKKGGATTVCLKCHELGQ